MTTTDSAAIRVPLRVLNAIAVNEIPNDDDLLALITFAASHPDSPANELAYEVIHKALKGRG
jgi:hypothetical protein